MIRWILPLFLLAWNNPCHAQMKFLENAAERGIGFIQFNGSQEKNYIVEAKGAGVAVGDVNNDGWDDVYFVNGSVLKGEKSNPAPKNRLYINNGDATFRDYTDESGLGDEGFGIGAFFADVDRDGDLDCYLTNFGPNELYLNDGNCRFSKTKNASGAQDNGWSTGAAFGDVNGDGFLDLYVGNYALFTTELAHKKGTLAPLHGVMQFIGPAAYDPAPDRLFLNNGDGTFRDATKVSGINSFGNGRAFTAKFSDLDNDGDLDIYVANDTTYNQLYENTGNGTFEDVSLIAAAGLSESGDEQGGMGMEIRDYDGDLDLDIFVTNYQDENNILYRNDKPMQFTDCTYVSGFGKATAPLVGFGLLVEDFNNDGYPDAHVANGHVYPAADQLAFLHGYAQNALFLQNKDGGFVDITGSVDPEGKLKAVSRGSAAADFDRDGDLDIVVNNLDGKPFYLENRSDRANWLQVAPVDENGMPAYGAKVTIEAGGKKQVAELYSSHSFVSQSSATIHFGLGSAPKIDAITIRWTDGNTTKLENQTINQRIVIRFDRKR